MKRSGFLYILGFFFITLLIQINVHLVYANDYPNIHFQTTQITPTPSFDEIGLHNENNIAPSKDIWDKLSSISGLVSGVLISLIGGVATYVYRERERRSEEDRKQRELSILQVQTIQTFMPQLQSGDQKAVEAALLAISALGNFKLATDLAMLYQTQGAVSALSKIASNPDSRQTYATEKSLRNLEFLIDSNKPILNIDAFITLKPHITEESLGDFRVVFKISSYFLETELLIGGFIVKDDKSQVVGRHNFVISKNPDIEYDNREVYSLIGNNRLVFGTPFRYGKSPFENINHLDHSIVNIYVTEPLISQIDKIGIIVNDYLVLSINETNMDKTYPKVESLKFWPFSKPTNGKANPWLSVHNYEVDKQYSYNTFSPFRIEFSKNTPHRISSNELEEIQSALAYG